MLDPKTPVIIGVGQSRDRVEDIGYRALSASDLAAAAARGAIADAGASSALAPHIGAIATTRTFEDTLPKAAIFGKSSNFPRSVAQRLGIVPELAVWGNAGGNSPLDLVSEFAQRIADGEFKLCLIVGAEAISTIRHAASKGLALDFAEDPAGSVEDRGTGIGAGGDPLQVRHGIVNAPVGYGLFENARRRRLGLTREAYALEMGRLFAPFAKVAHENPNAAWVVPAYSIADLIEVDDQNRWVADPYPLRLVARDQVNLGAAVLIASLETARRLGVPDDKLVYLHGHARAIEKRIIDRPDLGASPAARAAATSAIRLAAITVEDILAFDFYSCFPVAVFNVACDGLGLPPDDPRMLTVTGGLPFFGGPGNNYSMHAMASMVKIVRDHPGGTGFVGANGGYLSKYSVCICSTHPKEWSHNPEVTLQRDLDAAPSSSVIEAFDGIGRIETYTIHYDRGRPLYVTVIGRDQNDRRFIARSFDDDSKQLLLMQQADSLDQAVQVWCGDDRVNRFRLAS